MVKTTATTTERMIIAGSPAATPTPVAVTAGPMAADQAGSKVAVVPKTLQDPAIAANVKATAELATAAIPAMPPTRTAPATPTSMARASSVSLNDAAASAEMNGRPATAAPYALNWSEVGGRGGPPTITPPTPHCGPG